LLKFFQHALATPIATSLGSRVLFVLLHLSRAEPSLGRVQGNNAWLRGRRWSFFPHPPARPTRNSRCVHPYVHPMIARWFRAGGCLSSPAGGGRGRQSAGAQFTPHRQWANVVQRSGVPSSAERHEFRTMSARKKPGDHRVPCKCARQTQPLEGFEPIQVPWRPTSAERCRRADGTGIGIWVGPRAHATHSSFLQAPFLRCHSSRLAPWRKR
jgi:hypothetical protein